MVAPAPVKILLVDDRAENLLALAAILEPLGHTLISVQTGEEALKQLLNDDFAVVLLDVRMPGMDGFEIATLMRKRERLQATPIIFLTAISTSEEQIAQGYALGAVDYLLKPLEPTALRAKVAAFVELYRVRVAAQQQLREQHEALRRSIAEQAQAEQALRKARDEQDRLYQIAQEAIREREALFSAASHELKTPLTTLLGSTALLRRRIAPGQPVSDKADQLIDTIQSQAERLQRMIDLVLDTAQLEQGELVLQCAPLDLGALVTRVVSELQATVSIHSLIYAGPNHPVQVHGDALRLEQVVHNLVSNAIKYSPAGGPIRVTLMSEGQVVSLTVRDPGIGIPKEAQHRLFQRFSRLRNSLSGKIRGLGVGLYMVKQIVTLHGGTVGVESMEGQGSTFFVSLPLLADDNQEPAS